MSSGFPRSPHTPAAHPPTRNKPPASSTGAAQLSITALVQKLGAQGKQTRQRQPVIVPEQQLSLFGALAAAD